MNANNIVTTVLIALVWLGIHLASPSELTGVAIVVGISVTALLAMVGYTKRGK